MKKLCLLLLLILALICSTLLFACGDNSRMTEYDGTGYLEGNASFNATDVKKINVVWISGDVIVLTEGEEVKIDEESSNEKMQYKLENGVLNVYYAKSNAKIGKITKNLTLTLPVSLVLDELTLGVTDGDISCDIVSAKRLECLTADGNVTLKHASGEDLFIKNASGDIRITDANFLRFKSQSAEGSLSALSLKTDNAKIEFADGNVTFADLTAKEVTINGASGNVMIGLSDKVGGYSLTAKVIDGEINANGARKDESGKYVYFSGDGITSEITINLVDGNVGIVTP
ncbi:MAG: DUF4097 family beta strand repeat protein [Clostridia bacterium]|nr:DUF4097 family beta strand repeat protein [Clostridia bacterium]